MNALSDDRERLIAALAAIPPRLAVAARAASPDPSAPGEWTPSDIVRHLIAADLEVWHPRLAQLAAEDHPRWPWVDTGRWTAEPEATLDRLLDAYTATRPSTVAMLSALDESGWARTGTHATFGELDAAGLMARALDHDEEHLASFDQADAPG